MGLTDRVVVAAEGESWKRVGLKNCVRVPGAGAAERLIRSDGD
jgi:hypothetical protein